MMPHYVLRIKKPTTTAKNANVLVSGRLRQATPFAVYINNTQYTVTRLMDHETAEDTALTLQPAPPDSVIGQEVRT